MVRLHRTTLVSGRLPLAEARGARETQRAEVPFTHLIVHRLTDRSNLLDGLPLGEEARERGDAAGAERCLGRADKVGRPEPGARRPPRARLPASRDFR